MDQEVIYCQQHQQQCVIIDVSAQCNPNLRYLCTKCLIGNDQQNRILLKDANTYYDQIRNQFKEMKIKKDQQNQKVWKDFAANVISIKNFYIENFDNILNEVNETICDIEDQSRKLEELLQKISIHQYIQQNEILSKLDKIYDMGSIQKQFESMLDPEKIEKCLNNLKQLNNKKIVIFESEQEKETIVEEEKHFQEHKTDALRLICQTHKKEIIFFDFNQEKPREDRLICQLCVSNQIGFGRLIDIEYCKKLWQDYVYNKKEMLSKNSGQSQKRIISIQQELNHLSEEFSEKINVTNQNLSKQLEGLKNYQNSVIKKINYNWNDLSRNEALEIADTLSQPQVILQDLDYDKQDQKINQIVQEMLCYLKDICRQTMNNLHSKIRDDYAADENQESQIKELSDDKQDQILLNKNTEKEDIQNQDIDMVEEETQIQLKDLDQNEVQQVNATENNLEGNPLEELNNREIKEQNDIDIVFPIKDSTEFKQYQLISEYSINQSETCNAIAINYESSIMVAGSGINKIKVYEFNKGKMLQKQVLNDHDSGENISTLYFMKNENKFISGTDKQIGIWSFSYQQFFCSQLIKQAHKSWVNRVIMNNDENQIISCSNDHTIKFWIYKEEWECLQTLNNHKGNVESISLNESSNQLVSCAWDNQILISEQANDQRWKVVQKIKITSIGQRICFIGDNYIVFQPDNGNHMVVYTKDEQSQQFEKSKDVPVQKGSACDSFFPMTFNKQRQILINKNGSIINLIRFFNIEQKIEFKCCRVWGVLSDNCDYLVTWDASSHEFQVRKSV